jgi:hypothetical protein
MILMAVQLAWSLWLLIPVAVIALVVGFPILLFVVALIEKHPVHAFDATPLAVMPPDLPSYVGAMNDAAARAGYTYGGIYAHAKGGMYQVHSCLWMAPDRRVLADVSGGTILKMSHKKTLLYSRTADGRYLVTTDEFGSANSSGIEDIEVVVNATFEELVVAHLRRVHTLGPQGVPPFDQPSPLEARRQINLDIVLPTIAKGLGRWVNDERTVWVYSMKGALRLATVGLFGGAVKLREQQQRLDRPRPGAKVDRGFAVLPPSAPPVAPRQERDFLP